MKKKDRKKERKMLKNKQVTLTVSTRPTLDKL